MNKALFILFSFYLSTAAFSLENKDLNLVNASKTHFVSPHGDDKNSGLTHDRTFKTIQRAINLSFAGETIVILSGEYYEDLHSVRSGEKDNPIRITGMKDSILKGKKRARIFEINHSYIELSNFSIDGKVGKGDKQSDYRDKLVYIKGRKDIGVEGVKLLGMNLQHAYGECVRIKYLASNNEVAYSQIKHCGLRDYVFNRGKHNGEAIYIGTAPEQIVEGKNPTKVVDSSHGNWIHHNTIIPYGSECIDVKEGSYGNILEYNLCTQQKDSNVGGISIRGNKNIIRKNVVFNNLGAGIRLGGDTPNDALDNIVYANNLDDNEGGGLKIMSDPQKNALCGNNVSIRGKQKKIRIKSGKYFILEECK